MACSNQNKGHLGSRLVLQYYVFIYIMTQTLNHLFSVFNGVQPLQLFFKKDCTTSWRGWNCWWFRNPAITSWYGKYPSIYMFFFIPGGCLGFLNHQHNEKGEAIIYSSYGGIRIPVKDLNWWQFGNFMTIDSWVINVGYCWVHGHLVLIPGVCSSGSKWSSGWFVWRLLIPWLVWNYPQSFQIQSKMVSRYPYPATAEA